MYRRSFIAGLAAAIAVIDAFSISSLVAPVPTIYADGVRDDSAGLQAFFDGKPFLRSGDHFKISQHSDGSFYIGPGIYRVDRMLDVRGPIGIYGASVRVLGKGFVHVHDNHKVFVAGCHIAYTDKFSWFIEGCGEGSTFKHNHLALVEGLPRPAQSKT